MPLPATTEPSPTRSARTRGIAAALVLMPAIAPLGLAVGVALESLSMSPIVCWLSAPMLLAGASQLVLFTQVDDGANFLFAAGAAILLNGRFVIYGAALAGRFDATQPRWFRMVGPHYIVDQTYAIALNDITDADTDDDFRSYFTTAGTMLFTTWTIAVGLGVLLGPVLPPQMPLEIVLPASFVALIAPNITHRAEVATVVLGGAAVLVSAAPAATLFMAAVGGAAIGVTTSRTS